MDHPRRILEEEESNATNSTANQTLPSSERENMSDKLTPLLNLGKGETGPGPVVKQDGFCRQHQQSFADFQQQSGNAGGEEMEIQIQEEGDDYGDIQFFHHKLLLQQHLGHNEFGIGSFGSPNGLVNTGGSDVDAFQIEDCDDNGIARNFSENPFAFPDMEYGEPQFFPGNVVGYLETILEETDEEEEEGEQRSGRNWWTADSDTDTDSVIRVDNSQNARHSQLCNNNNNHSTTGGTTNLKSIENVEDLSLQSTFRSSASSRPFELEDLHLLDQLDLAFEETLMEPRRRSGIAAFNHQLHLLDLDQPLEKMEDERRVVLQRSASHDGETRVFSSEDLMLPQVGKESVTHPQRKESESRALGNSESKETFGSSLSPSSSEDSSEPPREVAEEDFFYSSPGSDDSEEGSSSDDSEKNGSGVVLAEFSLTQTGTSAGFGGSNNSFNSGMGFGNGGRARGSLESPSSSSSNNRLKSFRSFDSLNSLSGTELLFSKADTFPSFHYIKEDVEPGSSDSGSPTSPRCNLNPSSSTTDVPRCGDRMSTPGEEESHSLPSHHNCAVAGFPSTFNKIMKKTSHSSSTSTASSSCNSASGMRSSENLSEDSGIGGIGPEGGGSSRKDLLAAKRSNESFSDETDQQDDGESAKSYIAKSEFALNPLVFSSLSSSETGSNSMQSVPSLNTNESSPSADLSEAESLENHGERTEDEVPSPHALPLEDEGKAINHNSLSNFHQEMRVGRSDSSKSPQPGSNDTPEPRDSSISSNIPFEPEELPISINEGERASDPVSSTSSHPNGLHCSPHTQTQGLHPYSDSDANLSPTCRSNKADEANTPISQLDKLSDKIPDSPNSNCGLRSATIADSTTGIDNNTHGFCGPNVPLSTLSLLTSTHLQKEEEQCQQKGQSQLDSFLAKDFQPFSHFNDDGSNASAPFSKPSYQSQSQHEGGVHLFGVPYMDGNKRGVEGEVDGSNDKVISNPIVPPESRPSADSLKTDHLTSSSHNDQRTKSRPLRKRERSLSESEFESVESAVELDTIGLAYVIVNSNSPTSSSPAIARMLNLSGNEPNSSPSPHNQTISSGDPKKPDISKGESGTVSALVGRSGHGMQQKVVDVENMVSGHREYASPQFPHHGHANVAGPIRSGGPADHDSIEPTYWPEESGIKNAKISLHHPHPCNKSNSLNSAQSPMGISLKEGESLPHATKVEIASLAPSSSSSSSSPQCEAVGQEHGIGIKPSRSVNPDKPSSSDVVHQSDEEVLRARSHKSECSEVDKSNRHLVDYNFISSRDREDGLVVASPIAPSHSIGVAEVKKFSQLDVSVSRKHTHHHPPHQSSTGERLISRESSEGEEERRSVRFSSHGTERDPVILGQSNFGFFGRSSLSSSKGNLDPHILNAGLGSSVKSVPSSSTQPSISSSSFIASGDSSEYPSQYYGFPSSHPNSNPIEFHSSGQKPEEKEGDRISKGQKKETEIPELHNNKRHCRREKGHLHLEDIKCGIHPENFTIPLGLLCATINAVAPSLPSVFHPPRPSPNVLVLTQDPSSSSSSNPLNAPSPPRITSALVKKTASSCGGSSEGDIETSHTASSDMEVDTKIETRTYGPHNEVEVVLVSRNSRTPSPSPVGASGSLPSSLKHPPALSSSSLGEEDEEQEAGTDPLVKVPRTRVHFSPVVSEISWRESYIDQGSEFSGSTEDIHTSGTSNPNGHSQAEQVTSANANGESAIGFGDSLVRPLQVTDAMEGVERGRQPSPVAGDRAKGPILVEKVQMRSSFLQGGDDEEDEEDLERKLTRHIKEREDALLDDGEDFEDGPRKEGIHFSTGATSSAYHHGSNGVVDLYEDVNVEIEPNHNTHGTTTLSMVPDLLSQCENASNAQTHIDVCIEEITPVSGNTKPPLKPKPARKSHSPTPKEFPPSEIPPPPTMEVETQQSQQQIFPKIFAEDVNGGGAFGKLGGSKSDSKNNSSSSLNKGKKSSKGFGLGSGSKKSTGGEQNKERVDNKDNTASSNKDNQESDSSKENKNKGNKPGFFERLSKIRLSGSKQKKQKVHPKMDDMDKGVQPLKSQNAVNLNGSSSNGNSKSPHQSKLPGQPILKKTTTSTNSVILTSYSPNDYDEDEHEPSVQTHQAFENILEEIAGIKKIQMRMDKPSTENGTPERQVPPPKEMRSFAKRKQFYASTESSSPSPPVSPHGKSLSELDKKLSQFKEETSKTRDDISKSHPDLELIEDMVRQQSTSPEPKKNGTPTKSTEAKQDKKSPKKSSASETGQKNEREWYKLLKSAAEKYYYRGSTSSKDKEQSSRPKTTGIVETDLDTGASREMLDAELVELDKKVSFYAVSTSEIPSTTSTGPITTIAASPTVKARSLTNLSSRLPLSIAPSKYGDDVDHLAQRELNDFDERAKSYEFLLDDNQKSSSVPPENKLRTEARQLSEHELRIQRSLQRLNVPEWYKAASRTSTPDRPASGQDGEKSGTLKLLSRRSEFGSSGGLAGGWAGLSASKAPSMSSLQSSNGGRYSGSLNRSNFTRGRPATMSATRLSRESLVGSASHSPSAYDRCSFTYGMPFAMTRFGQGRMSNNSGTVTPTSTADSTASTSNPSYVKKPYLGWRSQERLNALARGTDGAPKLSVYLPPEERLAADLLRSRTPIRPPISDRPPLPKPPPRSEKTTLSTKQPSTDIGQSGSHTANSIPPPSFADENGVSSNKGKSSDVHDSIREVTKAINQFVSKGEAGPKPQPRKKSPGRKAIWIESSFVGRKQVDK